MSGHWCIPTERDDARVRSGGSPLPNAASGAREAALHRVPGVCSPGKLAAALGHWVGIVPVLVGVAVVRTQLARRCTCARQSCGVP